MIEKLYLAVVCLVFSHDFRVVQVFSEHIRKLRCDRCGGYFGMNDQVQCVLPWDEEFEKFHCEMYDLPRTNR